jgi:hypothetical protein
LGHVDRVDDGGRGAADGFQAIQRELGVGVVKEQVIGAIALDAEVPADNECRRVGLGFADCAIRLFGGAVLRPVQEFVGELMCQRAEGFGPVEVRSDCDASTA